MIISVYWYFRIEEEAKKVGIASPWPWIDPEGISKAGDLYNQHLKNIAGKCELLQKRGWRFTFEPNGLKCSCDCTGSAEAKRMFTEAGINIDGLVFVSPWKQAREFSYE
jgi:hypothetical protein